MNRRALAGVAAALGMALPVSAFVKRRLDSMPRPGHRFLAGAPLLIAHRGGAELAPENTLLAFRRALEWWEADMLELDVHASSDGEAVVIHDSTVDRTTGGRGRVSAFSLDRLRELDAGYRFTRDGGRSYPFRGRGEHVPTLHEVLAAFPQTRIIVEIKDAAAQLRIQETVRDFGAEHRVLLAAQRRPQRALFAGYPGPTSAAAEELYSFLLLHRLRATRLFSTNTDALQVPERHRGRRVLTAGFIRDAQRQNLPVHVWTVNEETDMRRLLDWGVDGIITDRPDLLAHVLNDRYGRPLPPGGDESPKTRREEMNRES